MIVPKLEPFKRKIFEVENKPLDIMKLFLEKYEKLNDREKNLIVQVLELYSTFRMWTKELNNNELFKETKEEL